MYSITVFIVQNIFTILYGENTHVTIINAGQQLANNNHKKGPIESGLIK